MQTFRLIMFLFHLAFLIFWSIEATRKITPGQFLFIAFMIAWCAAFGGISLHRYITNF